MKNILIILFLATVLVGQPSFTTRIITEAADGAADIYATDLDSDGDMDMVSALFGKIDWYKNDGSESFTVINIITTNNQDTPTLCFEEPVCGCPVLQLVYVEIGRF